VAEPKNPGRAEKRGLPLQQNQRFPSASIIIITFGGAEELQAALLVK
jgi:hypothetical protein